MLLLAFLGAGPAFTAPLPPEAQAIVEEALSDCAATGLSVAAVGRQGLIWSGGAGLADPATQRAADGATLYQFASVTKVFTGLLLAQLVAEAKVDLDAPISHYVPEFRPRYTVEGTRQPTVLDLATHTAGLTRDMIGPKASGRFHVYTEKELFDWVQDQVLVAPPGLQSKYSNYGFAVMGSVLERAAGKPYRDLVRERVLTPLGMTHSGFGELRAEPALAIPQHKQGEERKPFTDISWDFGAQAAASELISSVEDMAKFAHAHLCQPASPVVPDRVRTLLFAQHFPAGGEGAVGLAWFRGLCNGMTNWSHGGSVNHFNTLLMLRPDVGLGLVLAANGEAPLGNLAPRLFRLLTPQADTAAMLPWVGDYLRNGTRAMIRLNEDAVLTIEVHGAVRLSPLGPATYRITEGLNTGEWVRFVRENDRPVMIWESSRWERGG